MNAEFCHLDRFPALEAISWIKALFIARCPGVDVATDPETSMKRLEDIHAQTLRENGFAGFPVVSATQVHGREVRDIGRPVPEAPVPATDGLTTGLAGVCLSVRVADCAAVYLVDRATRAIGLVHSGKKGTELDITGAAIARMGEIHGTRPADLLALISPCIRPPHYEIDFAAHIATGCRAAGVGEVFDCGVCTASDPERYYSYRREKGRTGRMLALLTRMG